jgi:DNA polymerase
MGAKKFAITCKDQGLKLPDSLLQRAHKAFREKYPMIPLVWDQYEKAAIYAVLNRGKKVTVKKVTFYVQGEFLFAKLPSGRRLAYYKPEIRNEETPWGDLRPKLYHYTVDSKTKQWVLRATYGGMITENIVQAISRDCMAEAMVRCENVGYKCLITVHDENLTERKIGEGSLEEFDKLMSKRPAWGLDIPLKVGAWAGKRYRK